MTKEAKYIIVKREGKLKGIKFPYCHSHYFWARDLGYRDNEVIETGIIQGSQVLMLECKDQSHLNRRNIPDSLKWSNTFLKSREIQSTYLYKYTALREGD